MKSVGQVLLDTETASLFPSVRELMRRDGSEVSWSSAIDRESINLAQYLLCSEWGST